MENLLFRIYTRFSECLPFEYKHKMLKQAIEITSQFSIANIPWGTCLNSSGVSQPCTRIGNLVLSLRTLEDMGLFSLPAKVFQGPDLSSFMKLPRSNWQKVRSSIQDMLKSGDESFDKSIITDPTMQLPVQVTDFTDFSASLSHAITTGKDVGFTKDDKLLPNMFYMPVAYHSRASSVVVSGTPIRRPIGQVLVDNKPVLRPTASMDFELEMGYFIGGETNAQGEAIDINRAEDVVFGLVLVNDWSSRDIQVWESHPLGPFVSKSYATSISPWVISLDALADAKVKMPKQDPPPLSYLDAKSHHSYDIDLELAIKTNQSQQEHTLIKTNLKHQYWTINQQIAHHTITGCPLRVGTLIATGTVSGQHFQSFGSLLEWHRSGNEVVLGNDKRLYLEDGDLVVIRGETQSVGFGELSNLILPR